MASDDGMAVPDVEEDEDALGEGPANFTSPGTVITSSTAFMRLAPPSELNLSLPSPGHRERPSA